MKKLSSALSFGLSTVRQTRTNVSVPQVVATTTRGGFRLTPMVSNLLDLKAGDNVMFINNVNEINAAITSKQDVVVDFCKSAGLDIDSPEAKVAIHNEFDLWGIAKGVPEYTPNGEPKTALLRLSKKEKLRKVASDFENLLEQALASGNEALVEALTKADITKEEQMEIISEFMQGDEVQKFTGSRVANPSGMNGTGVTLTFSDSNVWQQLKADLGFDMDKTVRTFEIDTENIQTVAVHDGHKEVDVKVLLLGKHVDVVRDSKEDDELDEVETEHED